MANVIAVTHNNFASPSTAHLDLIDERFAPLRRPRHITFYCNGDRQFKGLQMSVTPHRFNSFEELLDELTRRLYHEVNLPMGVRRIYSPRTGRRIRDVDELYDAGCFVCAGMEPFKPGENAAPLPATEFFSLPPDYEDHPHHHHHSAHHSTLGTPRGADSPTRRRRHHLYSSSRSVASDSDALLHQRPDVLYPLETPSSSTNTTTSRRSRVITIIRNGPSPRMIMRILLNKRVYVSMQDLLNDITSAMGPRWGQDPLRKLYTLNGRRLRDPLDVFEDMDDTFIGVGTESLTKREVREILSEFYPPGPQVEVLLQEWMDGKQNHAVGPTLNGRQRGSSNSSAPLLEPSTAVSLRSRSLARDPHEALTRGSHHTRTASEPAGGYEPMLDSTLDVPLMYEHQHVPVNHYPSLSTPAHGRRITTTVTSNDDSGNRNGMWRVFDDRITHLELERMRAALVERERVRQKQEEQAELVRIRKGFLAPPGYALGYQSYENSFRRLIASERERIEALRLQYAQQKSFRERRALAKKADDERLEIEALKRLRSAKRREPVIVQEIIQMPPPPPPRPPSPPEIQTISLSMPRRQLTPPPRMPEQRKEMERKRRGVIPFIGDPNYFFNKYKLGRTLGEGNFATVREAMNNATKENFAAKIIYKSKLKAAGLEEAMLDDEVELMRACQHPNIVRLLEEYESNDEIFLVMDLLKNGDLFDAIVKNIKFDEPPSALMVHDLASAIYYLHCNNIVHRDIKPENLMVVPRSDGMINLKLCDFGLATEVHGKLFMVCGTPTYIAPEILEENGYGLEVDNWAIGVITYILLCGFPPFRSLDRSQTELFEFIKAGEFEFLEPYWDNIPEPPRDLIKRLLVVDPKERITALDVLCHPWILGEGVPTRVQTVTEDQQKRMMQEQRRHNKEYVEQFQRDRKLQQSRLDPNAYFQ